MRIHEHNNLSFQKRRKTDISEHLDLGTISLMMSSLEAAHDVLHPLQRDSGFPWKENLADRAHHPQFMSTSLAIRDGKLDQTRLQERISALKNQDKTNPLVSSKVDTFKGLATSVPIVWNEKDLDITEGEVRIVDFPSKTVSHSKADVIELLKENVRTHILICQLLSYVSC